MKNFALLILLFASVTLQAQPGNDSVPVRDCTHVTKTYKNGGMPEEDYYLNANGSKDGPYRKFTKHGKVYIQGQYKDGFPIGEWNYYTADTSGELIQTLNFDTHKETFVDKDRAGSLICGPRFFGGNMLKQEYIQERIKTDFTPAEREKLKGKKIMAVFEVDSVSYTTYAITIEDKSLTPELRAKMMKIIQEMPAWLPPTCRTGTMVWRHSVIFLF